MHATAGQRVGIALAFFEACAFGIVAALHLGWSPTLAGVAFSAPFLYAAAIVEGILGLALLLAVLLPGDGAVRAGRVLAAQILAIIGIFVTQLALLRGALLGLAREEVFHAIALVLALASLALVASPVTRTARMTHNRA